MTHIKGLEWTFDKAADLYDRMRPGYPDELYQAIFDYIRIGPESSVVEVGSGAGQATSPLLRTGCRLISVEYGSSFADLLSEKYRDCPNFSVINGRFEETSLPNDSFDLVYSATAFHWVPEKEGYTKVFSMLRKGGAFARFANHPFAAGNDPDLCSEINGLYGEYYASYHNRKIETPKEYSDEEARTLADIASAYGFTGIRYKMFKRERVFTASEYISLLGTYSDHIAIEESIRTVFFSKVEEAIQRHGGTITICDTIDLELARKE
ncbi:MAG: class I SAM-dependent methyltransferase [Clostridiales bacterium]|nr:class I SAM-dependent methyltransferase [Clostridiales bacterium]